MLRHHMSVITADNRLKREVQRVTASTASTAAFAKDLTALDGERKPDLVIVDARTERPPVGLHTKVPSTAKMIFIVGDDHLIWATYTDARGEIATEHFPAGDAIVLPASREDEL